MSLPTMNDFPITFFHNQDCGTSRNAGYAPTVVEYLRVGWNRPPLERLLAGMAARP